LRANRTARRSVPKPTLRRTRECCKPTVTPGSIGSNRTGVPEAARCARVRRKGCAIHESSRARRRASSRPSFANRSCDVLRGIGGLHRSSAVCQPMTICEIARRRGAGGLAKYVAESTDPSAYGRLPQNLSAVIRDRAIRHQPDGNATRLWRGPRYDSRAPRSRRAP
jgi:hypothetical protein